MAPRRTGVTPPPFAARPFGLFSVAPPEEFEDVHERNGVDWRAEPYTEAKSYADSCERPATDRSKDFARTIEYREADPFTVYGGDVCSTVGIPFEERDRRATAAVQNGEERAVERVLWTGITSNGEAVDPAFQGGGGVDVAGAGATLKGAVAALEREIAIRYGGVGTIHMPVDAASFAQGLLTVNGPRLETKLGTRVVAGAGYPGTGPAGEARPLGGAYLFATGPLLVRRSGIEDLSDFAGGLDRAMNDLTRVGERTYVVTWAGPLLYAIADLET